MKDGYSRAAPSPRYLGLIREYQLMHAQGDRRLGIPPQQTFAGQSLPPQAARIKRWITQTGAQTILDYGSGKGAQYAATRIVDQVTQTEHPDLRSYWGVSQIRCFDPAYGPFAELPQGSFHGVISTDVLEHCPEEDIGWILGELFAFAERFVFANVACYPAQKHLPSGGNAHCTIKPQDWWQQHIARAAATKPGLPYEFRLGYVVGNALREQVVTSAGTP